jgi:hypothetical protein
MANSHAQKKEKIAVFNTYFRTFDDVRRATSSAPLLPGDPTPVHVRFRMEYSALQAEERQLTRRGRRTAAGPALVRAVRLALRRA